MKFEIFDENKKQSEETVYLRLTTYYNGFLLQAVAKDGNADKFREGHHYGPNLLGIEIDDGKIGRIIMAQYVNKKLAKTKTTSDYRQSLIVEYV